MIAFAEPTRWIHSQPSELGLLVADYARLNHLQPSSFEQHLVTLKVFERFLAKPGSVADLSRDSITAFCNWYAEQTEPATVANKQTMLLAWWRWAIDEELTLDTFKRVKRVKVPTKVPQGWLEQELQAILNVCDKLGPTPWDRMEGCFSTGVRRDKFFRAFIWSYLSHGLRCEAGLMIRRRDVRPDLTFTARWQHQKTWCEQEKQFLPQAWAAICELGEFEYCLPYGQTKSQRITIRRWWNRLLQHAGLDTSPRSGPQQLRRTAASYKELQQPGSAQFFLGHKTPGLAAKHYIVPRIVKPKLVAGPELRLS